MSDMQVIRTGDTAFNCTKNRHILAASMDYPWALLRQLCRSKWEWYATVLLIPQKKFVVRKSTPLRDDVLMDYASLTASHNKARYDP